MSKKPTFFWASYADLMTSLFFIMLALFVLTVTKLNNTIKVQRQQLEILTTVEENLKPLKKENSLFLYEDKYKRFKLAFDVKFTEDKCKITKDELLNYQYTIKKIDQVGEKLKQIIDKLNEEKKHNDKLKNVSYILVISGNASKNGDLFHNYELSYYRAWRLWYYWKMEKGIDFEAEQYKDLIDLQISGNGWGGIGRDAIESNNQRFLIQIFPKIGDIQ